MEVNDMNEKDLINQSTDQDMAVKAAEESKLDKDITLSLLLSYGLPTIFAMVVMNALSIVDGIFAVRVLGVEAMAAITVFTPVILLMMAIGMTFSAGGVPVVMTKLGMKLNSEARQNFSLIAIITFTVVFAIAVVTFIFHHEILNLLGANYEIFELAKTYMQIAVWAFPLLAISQFFNAFLIADGKPMLAMGVSLFSSIVGIVLNYLALFVFDMGIEGLAWATIVASIVPVVISLCVFCNNKKGVIRFAVPRFDIKVIGKSMVNGTVVFFPSVAGAIVILAMNNVLVLMDGIGALGIALAGMVMAMYNTISVIFTSYLNAVGPLIGYNYGAQNHDKQKKLFEYNMRIIAVISVIGLVGTVAFAGLLMRIYLPSGTEIHEMAMRGLRITALAFLVSGFNVFAAGHFASLNKGGIGGILSTVRMLGVNLPLLLLLPRPLGMTGIWLAMPISEGIAVVFSIFLLLKLGKKYNYL